MSQPFAEFEQWRVLARQQLHQGITPEHANTIEDKAQPGLFAQDTISSYAPATDILIPKEFMSLARTVSCHTDAERWRLLYQALWRLSHGERHLFALGTDPVVRRLELMEKAVRRDAHKAKAFVRFRLVSEEETEQYIAWHQPDYNVLPLVAPFFSRRFAVMRWTILTPQCAVNWDGNSLNWADGLPKSMAPTEDNSEDLWRTYYRSTFNPARIKLKMMKREMPVRYWHSMPETQIIPQLLAEAPARVEQMLKYTEGLDRSAEDFLPAERTLAALKTAAPHCQGCPLYQTASCTVFGDGPEAASLMIVGEQPGDEEDKAGLPFIGPAGRMLDKALQEAGIKRKNAYLTNAVKHFKFKQEGHHRIHQTPTVREINACLPWLKNEIAAIKPKIILTLGVTPGRALLGAGFTLKDRRGIWHMGPETSRIRASYHPAAILRAITPAQRSDYYRALVDDLKAVALEL